MEQSLRGTLVEIKRQETFYLIAERHNYGVAEQVEKHEIGGALDDGTSKVLSEVLKADVSSPRKSFFPASYGRSNPPRFTQPGMYGSQPPAATFPFSPQQFVPVGSAWNPPAFGNQPGFAAQPGFGTRPAMGSRATYPGAAKRPKLNVPDKLNSYCYSCNLRGHWSGDEECPLVSGQQPPPPGSY